MTRPASPIHSAASAEKRAPIRLSARLLTCLAMCLLGVLIIYNHGRSLDVFAGPMALMWQIIVGQGLALVAAIACWGLFRLSADSEASARTIESYARLDLEGHNPLFMALAAAIGEELLFRAALQPLLGVWITSLVFVLTHVPVYRFKRFDAATLVQVAGLFATSVALGFIFQYVGLLAAMLVHLWIDIVGLLIVRAVIRSRA